MRAQTIVVVGAVAGACSGCVTEVAPELEMELAAIRGEVEALHAGVCAEIELAASMRELTELYIESQVESLRGPSPPLESAEALINELRREAATAKENFDNRQRRRQRRSQLLERVSEIPRLPC